MVLLTFLIPSNLNFSGKTSKRDCKVICLSALVTTFEVSSFVVNRIKNEKHRNWLAPDLPCFAEGKIRRKLFLPQFGDSLVFLSHVFCAFLLLLLRFLGHLYAAEALISLDRISDAITHLSPENVSDVSMAKLTSEQEQGLQTFHCLVSCWV